MIQKTAGLSIKPEEKSQKAIRKTAENEQRQNQNVKRNRKYGKQKQENTEPDLKKSEKKPVRSKLK